MRIIGVGFGRTGTLSLRSALERLGAGPCLHMHDLRGGEHADREARRWSAAFPDAPVLLNYRDFDGFYRSCERTVWAVRQAARAGTLGPRPDGLVPPPAFRQVIETLIWQGDFQDRFEDRAWMERMYADRLAAIRREIPAERLVEWRLGHDGWEPLARALGVPVPEEPFPHLHEADEFRVQAGLAQSA